MSRLGLAIALAAIVQGSPSFCGTLERPPIARPIFGGSEFRALTPHLLAALPLYPTASAPAPRAAVAQSESIVDGPDERHRLELIIKGRSHDLCGGLGCARGFAGLLEDMLPRSVEADRLDFMARVQGMTVLLEANANAALAQNTAAGMRRIYTDLTPELNRIFDGAAVVSDRLTSSLDTIPLGSEQRTHAHYIRSSTERVRNILRTYSNISILESTRFDPYEHTLDLGALTLSIANGLIAFAASHGIALHLYTVDPAFHIIQADPGRMSIVLNNLIGNAVKYSNPGGRVLVSIVPSEASGRVRWAVADEGIGIPAEKLQSIFHGERTAVSQAHASGTGFGLTLVNRLLRELSSAIHVESVLGQGSIFFFDLPNPKPN